jgi:hypothetical protein
LKIWLWFGLSRAENLRQVNKNISTVCLDIVEHSYTIHVDQTAGNPWDILKGNRCVDEANVLHHHLVAVTTLATVWIRPARDNRAERSDARGLSSMLACRSWTGWHGHEDRRSRV